jgi:hypothetical protein
MKLSEILLVAKYLLLSRFNKARLVEMVERERAILNVVAVLSGQYTFQQVKRALKTVKARPEMIYANITTEEPTLPLMMFYVALAKEEWNDGELSDEWREEEWW